MLIALPLIAADAVESNHQLHLGLGSSALGNASTIRARNQPIIRCVKVHLPGLFKNQQQGAEGLLVSADDFVLEDLAIEDTIGDALKIAAAAAIAKALRPVIRVPSYASRVASSD